MSDNFYRAFEDKFRGSRELIVGRLKVYLPFITPLKDITPHPHLGVDLGCGRGEWLELLEEAGFDAIGVDLDEGMLAACHQLQLNVQRADALTFLESLPDNSAGVISAFHVVEHIPFEALQKMVQEALRVLIPGGLLILETPNPENLQVGAHTFYYDPTHQRPIPPGLLAFLPEHYGFLRTKVLRLQQDPRLDEPGTPSLMDVLGGASPDYAIVAQKQAKAQLLAKFDVAFERDYGLTLSTLATRYDSNQSQSLEAARSDAQQAKTCADNASNVAQQAISSANNASNVAQQAVSSADNASVLAQQAMASASQMQALFAHFEATLEHHRHLNTASEERVNALLNSTSWRATAPLRWVSKAIKAMLRSVLLPAMRLVLRTPWLRKPFSSTLKLFPSLAHRLHLMAIHRGIVTPPAPVSPPLQKDDMPQPAATASTEAADYPLTPHAERMLNELKTAMLQHPPRA